MEDSISPPQSRLDMDAEIHQAINMAHRINDKLKMAPQEEKPDTEPIMEGFTEKKYDIMSRYTTIDVLLVFVLCFTLNMAFGLKTFPSWIRSYDLIGSLTKSAILTIVFLSLKYLLNTV